MSSKGSSSKDSRSQIRNEARPLGTKGSKSSKLRIVNAVDISDQSDVESTQVAPIQAPTTTKEHAVQLTLKGYSKNGKVAIYSGARTAIRIPKAAFDGGTALQTLDVDGLLAAKEKPAPKPKLTKEERAAARKNKPKPTIAERAAKARERADKLAAAAAAEAGQGASL